MRRVVALLVPLLIASACTDDASTAAPTIPRPTTTPAPTTTLFDAADPRPVVTIGRFAWNIPIIWPPRDLHDFAVYGDGTAVEISYRFADGGNFPIIATISTATVPAGDLAALVGYADAAGLDVPREHPPEPLPTGQSVVDGGYAVLTRRTADGVGIAAIDQPGSAQEGTENERRRALMSALTLDLPEMTDERPVSRWAIEAAIPLATIEAARWPWPDLDPDALAWTQSDAGIWCAVIDDPDWPYVQDEANDIDALQNGIFRRPLLPHEQTCDDVFAWRDELGMTARIPLFPDGLTKQP